MCLWNDDPAGQGSRCASHLCRGNNEIFEKESTLSRKTKELIAIGVAHTTQCPYCIEGHVRAAKKAGASDQEIAEAIFVAAALRAGGAFAHSTIAMSVLNEMGGSEKQK